MTNYRYLNIRFHDNDFSVAFYEGLKSLYSSMYDGENKPTDLNERLYKLHQQGHLKTILRRFIALEQGVWESQRLVEWTDSILFKTEFEPDDGYWVSEIFRLYMYFDFEIEFHNDTAFAEEWANGECFALDMSTGYVWSY